MVGVFGGVRQRASAARVGAVVLVLIAGVAGVAVTPAGCAAAGPAARTGGVGPAVGERALGRPVMEVTERVLWPNPDDHFGTAKTTLTTSISSPGNYQVWVVWGNLIANEYHIGVLGADVSADNPAQVTWTWDGRDEYGVPAPRGNYRMELMRRHSSGPGFDLVARSDVIEVHNGTGWVDVRDKVHDRYSGQVDVTWFELSSSPTRLVLEWDFRAQGGRHLQAMAAGVAVDGSRRGYLLNVSRRGGRYVSKLGLAILNSNAGRYTPVRCPGIRAAVHPKTASVTIPRSCLRVGGMKAQAYWTVAGARPGDYDSGPSSQLFTPWVSYEVPPGT